MAKDSDKLAAASEFDPGDRRDATNCNRNVWKWQGSPDDDTNNLLKSLDNDELQLEPTRKLPIPKDSKPAPDEAKPEPKPEPTPVPSSTQNAADSIDDEIQIPGKCFDPYNSS